VFVDEQEEIMRRFLLGAVTPQEREQVEDQLFAEGSWHDTLLLLEDQLTDEYLYGKLAPGDCLRFERYFLAAPQRQEKLRLAQSLRRYALQHKSLPLPPPVPIQWL
jgi:hypothetical protein